MKEFEHFTFIDKKFLSPHQLISGLIAQQLTESILQKSRNSRRLNNLR